MTRMTYRSDYNPAIDKSVEAGVLLRSTIDEVFSTDAFTFWYMRKWNIYLEDRWSLNVEAYIACVNKEEGIKVSDKADVIRALARSVMSGLRQIKAPTINGNGASDRFIYISNLKKDHNEGREANDEMYRLRDLSVVQKDDMTFDKINEFISGRDAVLHEYLSLQYKGYSCKEAAHKMGYTTSKSLAGRRDRFRYLNGDKIRKIIYDNN